MKEKVNPKKDQKGKKERKRKMSVDDEKGHPGEDYRF